MNTTIQALVEVTPLLMSLGCIDVSASIAAVIDALDTRDLDTFAQVEFWVRDKADIFRSRN